MRIGSDLQEFCGYILGEYMMKMGAQILSKIPYTFLFMNKSTKNQIWNPISMAAVMQLRILTIRSQVFISIGELGVCDEYYDDVIIT